MSWLTGLRGRIAGEGVGAVLVRGATGSAGAHVLGALLALLAQLVLARLLGVTQYGYYVYAFTWVMILAQLCRLGFHNSLIRFTAAYRTTADAASLRGIALRAFQFALVAALLSAVTMAVITGALAERMPADQMLAFLFAAALLIPLTLLGITQGLLQGYRRPARAMLPFRAFVQGGTLVLALAAAATTGLSTAPAAMALTLVAAIAALAVASLWVAGALAPDVRNVAPEFQTAYWVRASLPLLLMAGMRVLMQQTDTAMLGILASTDAAGLYFPVARMSELAAIGLASVNAIVAPMISELHTSGDRSRMQRLLTLAAIGTSAVTVAAAVAFWLAGEWVLGWFGTSFVAAYPALMTLLVGQMVNALCGPVGFLLMMTGHQDRASVVLVGGAVLNVVLNAILIPPLGLIGAAIATAISTAFWNLWMLVEVVRRHRLNPSVFARWPRLQA